MDIMKLTKSFAILREQVDPIMDPLLLDTIVIQFSIILIIFDPIDLGPLLDVGSIEWLYLLLVLVYRSFIHQKLVIGILMKVWLCCFKMIIFSIA